jgi:hypothetical protein
VLPASRREIERIPVKTREPPMDASAESADWVLRKRGAQNRPRLVLYGTAVRGGQRTQPRHQSIIDVVNPQHRDALLLA